MKVDASKSVHHESATARNDFNRQELKHLRLLLRRLRFLEAQVIEQGGLEGASASGGAVFAELEADALEWLLKDAGFLAEVSGNSGVSND